MQDALIEKTLGAHNQKIEENFSFLTGKSATWFATLLAVSSGLMFTASNYTVKAESLNTIDALLVRSVIQTILLAVIAKLQGFHLWPTNDVKDIIRIRIALIIAALSGWYIIFDQILKIPHKSFEKNAFLFKD